MGTTNRRPTQTQNLEDEIDWYVDNQWINRRHPLMRWPFVHPARHEMAYRYARRNMRRMLLDYAGATASLPAYRKALVAPCGGSADLDILDGLAEEFHGIDVSPEAVASCPASVITREGDILKSGYDDNSFDLVASFLFFHHLHQVGFAPFLAEFKRILRPGGALAVMEPSALYPVYWAACLGRKVFGNVSGLVPAEAPLVPARLSAAMRDAGFIVEAFRSVSFSHNRNPVPVQHLTNAITAPLQGLPPFSQTGWMCGWICRNAGV